MRGRAIAAGQGAHEAKLRVLRLPGRKAVAIDHVRLGARREDQRQRPVPGARALGVKPGQAAIFEDALAAVAAGRAGGFGCVLGVDRPGQSDALRKRGADVVVSDLAELLDDT